MITKVVLMSIIDNTAPGPDDEQARMILATTAGDVLALGIVVDFEQTYEVTDIDKTLVDDLADVLARTVVGWEDVIGHDLSQAPEVQRVMARYRQERADNLGARAARLVADMLQQAGRYLTHGYGEINEVLLEARLRGWLEPIE